MTENEFTIHLPKLFDKQKEIMEHPARFKVLCCGRRFSKTTICIDFIGEGLLQGEAVAYFAPIEVMTSEVWEIVKTTFAPLISRVRENEKRAEFHNGAVFECWTARSEGVRGRAYGRIVFDEAALYPVIAFWQEVIMPLLIDYQGKAIVASTPRGQNWFWELYQLGLNDKANNWQSWHYSSYDNPYIPHSELDALKDVLSERSYNQEILALFLEDSGSVFRNIGAVCTGKTLLYDDGSRYTMGIDWGRDHDFTAISVYDITNRRQVYLDRFNQISYTVQQGRVVQLYERFKPVVVLAEANSIGSVNIDALHDAGVPVRPFITTNQSKHTIIDNLVLALERATTTLLNDDVLKHELGAYRLTRTASGSWQYSAPIGGHDDTIIATALSYYAAHQFGDFLIGFV